MRADHLIMQRPDENARFAKRAVGSPHTTWSVQMGPQADEAPGLPVQRQPDLPDGEGAGRQVVVCTASDADREDTAEADVTARLT